MADVTLKTLTDSDIAVLRLLVADYRARVRNTTGRPAPEDEGYLPPEVYVAKTPAGGIGPVVNEDMTGTGTGTGTADEPGYADLDIWRLLRDTDNRWKLRRATAGRKRVYNLGTSSVSGDTWVLVLRDKHGQWYVSTGGGGSNRRLARLTGKRYATGPHGEAVPIYSGEFLSTSGNPPVETPTGEYFGIPDLDIYTGTGADIDTGTGTGTTVTGDTILALKPAYHVDNIDIPVPWVTEVWPSDDNSCYLFGAEPRWEFVQQTSEIDPVTATAAGNLLRWDQNTKTSKAVGGVVLVWFPPPPPFP